MSSCHAHMEQRAEGEQELAETAKQQEGCAVRGRVSVTRLRKVSTPINTDSIRYASTEQLIHSSVWMEGKNSRRKRHEGEGEESVSSLLTYALNGHSFFFFFDSLFSRTLHSYVSIEITVAFNVPSHIRKCADK